MSEIVKHTNLRKVLSAVTPTARQGSRRGWTLPEAAKSSVAGSYVPKNGHPESSDHYPAVMMFPNKDMRVIECPAAIQWIVQVRRPNGRWRNRHFCRTKAGLLLYARPITSELLALPDRFGDPINKRLDRAAEEVVEDVSETAALSIKELAQ